LKTLSGIVRGDVVAKMMEVGLSQPRAAKDPRERNRGEPEWM
jgi:hypothetical protein